MLGYLVVFLGAGVGGAIRHGMNIWVARWLGAHFPYHTFIINILGSFIIGFFSTMTVAHGRFPAPENLRLFVMVGICGGFTTFSAFSLQTLDLLRAGAPFRAGVNIVVSVVLCVLSVALGHYIASQINGGTRAIAQVMIEEEG